jgi:outer membrane protein assembly factor BamB
MLQGRYPGRFVGALSALLLLSLLISFALAQDWPQWRGPNRDGIVTAFVPPKNWPQVLKPTWKTSVGEGHSTPVVVGGRIYLNSRVGEQEVVASYDLRSGKEIWKDSYAAPYTMNPAATGHGKGPKSTPVVSGGRLYTLGISGTLSSYDISNGKLRWRKEFRTQFKQTAPTFGTAMSPVVDRGLLILHAGGPGEGALMALDANTGAVKWSWNGDGPAYASPIVVDLGGVRQVITQSQQSIVAVSEADGQLLWRLPFKTDYEQNAVTPIAFKDLVILSGLNQGVIALRPVKRGQQWAADQAWLNKEVSLYMNSPVLRGDILFGFSHRNKGQYFSLDVNTGKTLWIGDGRHGENASLQLAGDLLFTLDNDARLTVYPATAKLTSPVRQYQVAQSPTWAQPVILPGHILIKSFNSLELLSLE